MTDKKPSRWRVLWTNLGGDDGPPMMRVPGRHALIYLIPMAIFFLWLFIPGGLRASWRGEAWLSMWGFLAIEIVIIALIFIPSIRSSLKLRRSVKAAGYLACGSCAYDLSKLPPEGTCPECGEAYTHAQCRRWWKQVM